MSDTLIQITLIGAAGIGAQWAAWRLRIPAIALLLVAGFILGPVTGYLNPQEIFGDLYRPIISLAVAVVLFEGGLTLNFKEIKHTSTALRRIIVISGPLIWGLSSLAAHYIAGLDWPAALILGGILVVTGPTVIMPLLRQAQLGPRPASLLRWEAIVNDPIGALFAVMAFEVYLVIHGTHGGINLLGLVFLSLFSAIGGGYLAGKLIAQAFIRSLVPEYLKAPLLLTSVLLAFSLSNLILEETGLLTVTVMGLTLGNSRIASLTEMRRFKETVTILLVSALFIILTASLQVQDLYELGWGAAAFVFLILFVIRPLAIFIATIHSGISFNERILIAWIAPRGIVAVAVSGLFGSTLVDLGVADGSFLTALTFTVVATTILLHGFTLAPLARLLGLRSAEKPGLLLVGGSPWTEALAQKLKENDIPVLIADSNWNHIRQARLNDIPTFYGEVLSEAAHHDIIFNRYSHLIATTDNDAYNTLVCSEFGPEMGRSHVFQIGTMREESERQSVNFTVGGRPVFKPGRAFNTLQKQVDQGWTFQITRLTNEFSFSDYLSSRAQQTNILFWVKENGQIIFRRQKNPASPVAGDVLIAFGPVKQTDNQTQKASKTTNDSQQP